MLNNIHLKASFVLLMTALLIAPAGASAQTFAGYTMQLNGAAALISGGSILRVSPVTGGTGSAYIFTPFPITADTSFSTSFRFRIGDGSGADGMVFVVQNNGATALGGGGGNLGYSGLVNSIGVEIDEYFNGGWDPNNNHLGINTAGNMASVTTFIPPVNLDNGTPYYLWVDYDGTSNDLSVFFSTTSTKPGTPDMIQNLDLLALVGAQGYVGFTGATGGLRNNHDIQAWTFLAWEPPLPVPAVSSWSILLLILLMTGMTWGLRRQKRPNES